MSDNPINCTVTECPARTTDGRCYLLPQDCPQTLEAGILKANEHIRKRIQVKREKIDALDCQMQLLRMRLTPPCKFCQYEGEIRCTSCKDGDYEGFNVRHYPMHGDKTCFTCRKGPRCLEETARACTFNDDIEPKEWEPKNENKS